MAGTFFKTIQAITLILWDLNLERTFHPDPQCAEFRERFSKEQFLVPT